MYDLRQPITEHDLYGPCYHDALTKSPCNLVSLIEYNNFNHLITTRKINFKITSWKTNEYCDMLQYIYETLRGIVEHTNSIQYIC